MTREEHLAWAKQRALEYLPADPSMAMISMMSDLSKHDELRNHAGLHIAPLFYGRHKDPDEVRHWIEGFR